MRCPKKNVPRVMATVIESIALRGGGVAGGVAIAILVLHFKM